MARLLLVDPDPFMQRTVQKLLTAEGYFCATAVDAEGTHRALTGDPFDLVLLHLWRLNGERLTLLRQIRVHHHMPILVLAARGAVADMVVGLEVGADDYMSEPFDPRELVARVRAHLRRTAEYSRPPESQPPIDLGGVLLDVKQREAFRANVPLRLTNQEFKLLHLLASHRPTALASEWIFENVWGSPSELGTKALTVYVARLRQKIETDPHQPQILLSVRGFGYRIAASSEGGGV
jgi:DNA-binding response OmpR family regulator